MFEVDHITISIKTDLSDSIEKAFGHEGLGIIAVSGVPELHTKRNKLLPLSFTFATLPDSVKIKYERPDAYYSYGWSPGKEKIQGKIDLAKGSYYNNPETNEMAHELMATFPSFYSTNVWPTFELPDLEQAFMNLGQLIVDTGILLASQCDTLDEVNECPEYEKGQLYRLQGKCAKARLLHYYSLSEDEIAAQSKTSTFQDSFAWCGWHNDHGTLTGLVQAMYTDSTGATVTNPDPTAGLYVKTRRNEIVKVNIPPDHLVYQIGETSQILSGGILQATPHAVRGPQVTGVNRETFAVFMQPLPEKRMAVPSSMDTLDAGKTEHLPKGVPSLLSRWKNNMTFNDFTQATFKAYY
ncbi:unnamed protein product [Peronospora belbahrii]|uniref:Isopenicillin N synthase-like Fe(2+) 2OG dioxygenase domain-containing protein n=1 Tax=Peronospora belbahrii TaxID=622444 RepID=A0AAU9KPN5_9STRA|nr:unnamed protein product [Peronospora belbahrii]